jgi:NADH-quinone oxidoreductase subunit I
MGRYFRNIWDGIITVLIGMKVTGRHVFTPAVTIQYPDVKVKLPERARNRLYVNMDDCIGCDQCAMACPVDCITIETIKSTPDVDLGLTSVGTKKRLYVPRFDIDIAKCCYCGLCVYPCPTECIKMTDVYEFSEYERRGLIYNFAVMTPAEIDQAKAKLAAHEKEQAAKKAAAAAAPKAAPAAAPLVKPAPVPADRTAPGANPAPAPPSPGDPSSTPESRS